MRKKANNTSEVKISPKSLVVNRLEMVSKDAFRKYFSEITELIGNSPGIYALYDGKQLYYVGKSTELRKRVKQHLRDRHLASWTHFSLYLVRKAEHTDEIESLLVRVASPKGNRVVPKGKSRGPLLKQLKAMVKQRQKEEFMGLFGGSTTKRVLIQKERSSNERSLKGLVAKRAQLYRMYKGEEYTAWLNPNGTITFRRKRYDNPTAAARTVVNGSVNGWEFWYIEDLNGDWIKLGKYKE